MIAVECTFQPLALFSLNCIASTWLGRSDCERVAQGIRRNIAPLAPAASYVACPTSAYHMRSFSLENSIVT